ncbi:Hypothetical predicted protein, partial [Pelobates cultripes]
FPPSPPPYQNAPYFEQASEIEPDYTKTKGEYSPNKRNRNNHRPYSKPCKKKEQISTGPIHTSTCPYIQQLILAHKACRVTRINEQQPFTRSIQNTIDNARQWSPENKLAHTPADGHRSSTACTKRNLRIHHNTNIPFSYSETREPLTDRERTT